MKPVQSPCILVCSIDMKTGYCFGCGRTRDEISGWMDYSNSQRNDITTGLEARLETVVQRPRRETKRRRMQRQRLEATK